MPSRQWVWLRLERLNGCLMAKLYCDNTLYSTTLEWGIAQEGDGTAKTKAVPAMVSINLADISAVNGNTLAVAGRVVTVTGSYSAGALADHLASLINASSGTVTAAATNWPTPQLRDFAYARGPSNGAPANTLQIMTRAGSAIYNANSLCAVVSSGFTGGSVNAQFSGGSGGAFAYALRYASGLFPSQASSTFYGLLCNARTAGGIAAGDVVAIRPGEIASKATGWGATTFGMSSVSLVFDDGTEWPADIGLNKRTVMTFVHSSAGNEDIYFSPSSRLIGARHSNGQNNLAFKVVGSFNNNYKIQYRNVFNYSSFFKNVEFDASECSNTSNDGGIRWFPEGSSDATNQSVFDDCDFWFDPKGRAVHNSNGYNYTATYRGGKMGRKAPIASSDYPFGSWVGNGTWFTLNLHGVEFVNYVAGSTFCSGNILLNASDCSAVNMTPPSDGYAPCAVFSKQGKREFFHKASGAGYCQWASAQGFPTLNAVLPDLTPWSVKIALATSGLSLSNSFSSPSMGKTYSDTDGVVDVTLELLWSKTGSALHSANVWIDVAYVDTNGVSQFVSSYDALETALPTSSATWYPEQAGEPFMGAAVFRKHKVSVRTLSAVKSGTELSVTFRSCKSQDSTGQMFFIDPDFVVTKVV